MRFFKYLIFSFLFLFSSSAFSYWKYNYYSSKVFVGPTAENVCEQIINYVGKNKNHKSTTVKENGFCQYTYFATDTQKTYAYMTDLYRPFQVLECYYPDYKIVTQPVTGQIKASICLTIDGSMCKYVADRKTLNNEPIINGSITAIFESVSKTPDPNCQEELLNPPCDPKDPYGGCYTPPNQECTRQFDGSIVCPEEKEPPIEKGCNGADYCKRPPQGCGEGYVSGTFNGERICIKTKPSNGGGSDGGSDGGGSDGGG
ncbi:hypothetical protein H0P55_09995, partial [Acinetobacter indicus]|nr:hypothetical protein [Acinetobacter indicus]